MKWQCTWLAGLVGAFTLGWAGPPVDLPMEPFHNSGESVTGAFEGWYPDADGSGNILVGYYNRNLKQSIDIPAGPNNKIEPGGPDMGQPTHFLPGRQWGVFVVKVPKDFGEKRLTWTITANGKTTAIPLDVNPLYIVAPFIDAADNTPPWISFDGKSEGNHGPPVSIAKSYTAKVGTPLPLKVWVADDMNDTVGSAALLKSPPVLVTWTEFRGPSDVKFSPVKPKAEKGEFPGVAPKMKFTGSATTQATFDTAGEYILEVIANDWSGDGGRGFQCCWTTSQVKVTVTQ